MEQTYMAKALIDVDVNSQKYQDFVDTVEKRGATIKVNPDIDASKFLSKFEGLLRKHPEKLVIEADTSKINKSLSMVRGFVGKSGTEIGKAFSDSMKNGFDNASFDKMVRGSLKSGERISQKARASYIEDLNKIVSKGFNAKTGEFQINSKNYLEIEKIIDAYERLAVAKRELGTSTNKDILSALDNSSKYLKANPYENIGNNIAENINDMVASVEKAQHSAVSKLESFQTEIANILSGKGVSGATSTGNSHLSDSLAKENEALKSQIAILEKNSTKLQDAQKRLEAASLKLSRSGHLKGRSKGLVNEEFSSALSAFISEGGTLNKDIVEQNESLRGTKYYTQIEKELLAAFNLITKPNAKSPKDTTSNDAKQKLLDSIKQAGKNLVSLYHQSLEDDGFNDHKLADAYENFQKIGGSKKDLINAFKSKYGKTRFKDEILDFSASMQQDFGFPGMTKFLAGSDKIQQEYLETAQAAQTAQKAIEESNKSLNKQKTLSQKSYTVSFYGNKKDAEAGIDSPLKLLPKAQSFISKKPKIDNIATPESIPTDSSQNIQKELSDITTLKNAVKNVTQAVNEKTAAFQNEQKVVSSVAISEKNSLELVEGAITNVANGVNKISSSFQGERDEILAIINAIANDINSLITNLNSVEEKIAVFRAGMSSGVNSNTTTLPQDGSLLNSEVFSFVEKLNSLNIKEDAESKIIRLKTVLQSLNEIGKVKTGNVNIKSITGVADDFNKIFELATALELLISQLEKIQSLSLSQDLLAGLKVSSANVKNMNMMADALKNVSASLDAFKTDAVGVLNSISGITKQLEGLKNLNNILKSGKKVSEIVKDSESKKKTKTSNAGSKKEEENNNKLAESYGKLTEKAQKYFELLKKNASGQLKTSRDISELKSLQNDFKNAYNKTGNFALQGDGFDDIYNEFVSNSQEKINEFSSQFVNNAKVNLDKHEDRVLLGDVVNVDLYNEKLLQIKQYLEEIEKLTFDGILNGDTKDIETLVRIESEIAKIEKDLKSDKKFKPVNETKRTHDYERIQSWLSGNDSAPKHIREEIRQIGSAIYDVDNQADFDKLMSRFNELKAEVEATGKTGDSFATSWKKKMGQLGTYLASFGSFYQVINVLKKGLQTIREYNTVLTEMRKVSNENLKTLQAYQVETFDVADEVGTTSKTIQKSTADWMRLGEAIDEAKKSAKATAVLYNVSEFENIDEASDGLVSISQAYKDIEKMDIVDKINFIGNNYAIATDGLTEAMQRSSAALLTQGNNIDEAIALMTAGNTVIQDPEKVGTAATTISLRIAGTEAAKEELENLGEDIEDYVIRTTSKTDDIIKKYTTVASNDFEGISVLDDNGNLRNTYEILLDIAKIYKEIQEEDKKQGTNRANALIEELGGKRQANIVASILSNPDILESVYEDSKNSSKNSAQKELDKYLESLDSHFTRLQNSADKFWVSFVDSEAVKFITNFLNLLLKIENGLGNIVGSIPQIIGLISAVRSFKGEG